MRIHGIPCNIIISATGKLGVRIPAAEHKSDLSCTKQVVTAQLLNVRQ